MIQWFYERKRIVACPSRRSGNAKACTLLRVGVSADAYYGVAPQTGLGPTPRSVQVFV